MAARIHPLCLCYQFDVRSLGGCIAIAFTATIRFRFPVRVQRTNICIQQPVNAGTMQGRYMRYELLDTRDENGVPHIVKCKQQNRIDDRPSEWSKYFWALNYHIYVHCVLHIAIELLACELRSVNGTHKQWNLGKLFHFSCCPGQRTLSL